MWIVSSVFLWCDACGVIAQRLHHSSGGEISPLCLRMMSKALLGGFCQHLPRLRVLLWRVNWARLSWGFLSNKVFLQEKKNQKGLFYLQIDGGQGTWFWFSRAFMDRECAHFIRQLLCFGLEFALAFAGLCESISLFWLELWSMPCHRFAVFELMRISCRKKKPKAAFACGLTRAAECFAPRKLPLVFYKPHRVAVPASCSRRSTFCPSTFCS